MTLRSSTIPLLCALSMTSVAATSAAPSITTIDIRGSVTTFANDINDRGDVVGAYTASDGRTRGFLWSGDDNDVAVIEFPDAQLTAIFGVNNRREMVGHYYLCEVRDPAGVCALLGEGHPFVFRDGVFTPIDIPVGASSLVPYDINNRGDIVGTYSVSVEHVGSFPRGFLIDQHGTFHTVDLPNDPSTWELRGINDQGDTVGYFADVVNGIGRTGFLLERNGGFTTLDLPGGGESIAQGINARGDVVGSYSLVPNGLFLQGFVYSRTGDVSSFVIPGTYLTHADRINDRGQIVGIYMNTATGRAYGFVAGP